MKSRISILFTVITVIKDCDVSDFNLTKESILKQDLPDWEWVIKDCSSMQDLLNLPIDHRIKYLNKPDLNIYDAMNQAVKVASGEYVLFMNAGDYIYDVSTLRDIKREVVARDISFWYGNVIKPYSFTGRENYKEYLSKFYMSGRTICHQAWVLKSEVLRKFPYLTDFKTGEDILYQIRLVLGLKLSYAHLKITIAVYKGDGISQKAANIRLDQARKDIELKKYLNPYEYYLYKSIWSARSFTSNFLKRLIR